MQSLSVLRYLPVLQDDRSRRLVPGQSPQKAPGATLHSVFPQPRAEPGHLSWQRAPPSHSRHWPLLDSAL